MVSLVKTFLEITLTASGMLLLVMAVRALFSKRMNPAIMTALWMLILVRLIVPFTIESPLHIGSLFPAPAGQTAADEPVSSNLPHAVYSDVQPGLTLPYNGQSDTSGQAGAHQ